jgi:transposase
MRGRTEKQGTMLVAFNVDERIPEGHPLRKIKGLVDERLAALSPQFTAAYAVLGRPSIPPEQLLKALLLQALYSIRSERQLVEQVNWNVLYRWFVDLAPDAPVWDATTFTKNRERFAEHGLVQAFFDGVVKEALARKLASSDHFSVDGTLIQAYASLKSLKPKDGPPPPRDDDPGNPSVDFHGTKRSNATHESTTDPESKLMRKGHLQTTKLCHGASLLMENRHGLCVGVAVHAPFSAAEREAAPTLIRRARWRFGLAVATVGADAGYASGADLARLERMGVVAHVAGVKAPKDADAPGAGARHRMVRRSGTKGYAVSQRLRKRIEEIFGWMKTIGGQARTRFRGRWRLRESLTLTAAAYNLIRMARCAA